MGKQMHNVSLRKSKREAMRIVIPADKLRQLAKGAEREERKQSGTLFISGAGVHGNVQAENRRGRRDSKKDLARYRRGDRDDD